MRNASKPRPLPTQQRPLARSAMSHPLWFALFGGIFAGIWTFVIVQDWRPVTGIAAVVTLLAGLAWNHRWGWARREQERLYDENGRLRESG